MCDIGGGDILISKDEEYRSTDIEIFNTPNPYYLNGGVEEFELKDMEIFTFINEV